VSYELFNTQPTIQGRSHGEAASLNGVGNSGMFKRQSLKFEDAGDVANYLTSVAKTLARSVGSTWVSVYELSRDVKDSKAWAELRPASGEPPTSFADWWTTIFGQPISAFMELEHRYCLIKEYQPQLLTELNYDQARQLVEQFEKNQAQRQNHFVAAGQAMLDLYGEQMAEEDRQRIIEKVENGEKVTQQEVAAAAGVSQKTVCNHVTKSGQLTEISNDPPPSTRDTRRYAALSQIDGMADRIAAGESMRALAVEAGIEKPSLCLPRSSHKAAIRILRDFGNNPGWLLSVTEQLTKHLTENHANTTQAEEPSSNSGF